jgi:propionyl-CoA carboxylase alpha chain
LGDKHGNVIHLGERECSIQRRNQKVIEEAPSSLLDASTRKAMGAQAVALAKAVGYDSAGTVEFIAGQDKSFYFLEMNTRLQVEHPVTELVTGIDLVEQMIRVAAGERLKLKQRDVKLTGWAVEARIYAEDPSRNFLPSTGRLIRFRPPSDNHADCVTVRTDTGVYEGGEISLYYDPMIAKLCTHAAARQAAIEAMGRALDSFTIDGIRHNIAFLSAVMAHPRWRSGHISTGFIAEEFPRGFQGAADDEAVRERLVLVAAALDHAENRRKRRISGQLAGKPVKLSASRVVRLGNDWFDVTIAGDDGGPIRLCRGGAERTLESSWAAGAPTWQGVVDGDPVSVQVRSILGGYRLSHGGVETEAHVFTPREAELARIMPAKKAADSSSKLLCPMPGRVVAISVAQGQEVKAGEPLAIVEAMKMENVLRAERDAKVKAIRATEGESLAVDAVIMEFE